MTDDGRRLFQASGKYHYATFLLYTEQGRPTRCKLVTGNCWLF
jgi:hypothetical protein